MGRRASQISWLEFTARSDTIFLGAGAGRSSENTMCVARGEAWLGMTRGAANFRNQEWRDGVCT